MPTKVPSILTLAAAQINHAAVFKENGKLMRQPHVHKVVAPNLQMETQLNSEQGCSTTHSQSEHHTPLYGPLSDRSHRLVQFHNGRSSAFQLSLAIFASAVLLLLIGSRIG
jgi:hypothetical protein